MDPNKTSNTLKPTPTPAQVSQVTPTPAPVRAWEIETHFRDDIAWTLAGARSAPDFFNLPRYLTIFSIIFLVLLMVCAATMWNIGARSAPDFSNLPLVNFVH